MGGLLILKKIETGAINVEIVARGTGVYNGPRNDCRGALFLMI